MSRGLKIGELARKAGCLVETIRYYEREGLLPEPARSESNYRLYNEAHIERLQFIRECRSLDMSLEETRRLLSFRDTPEEDCSEVNVVLDEHINHVIDRISELKALQKKLENLRGLCMETQASRNCGILKSLGSLAEAQKRLRKTAHNCNQVKRTHK